MASLSFSAETLSFFAFFSVCLLLVSPAHSLSCSSQKFTNKLFGNCSDLPSLSSYLHWNYNATNSSLDIAFTATPAKSGGWISWGINPNGTGMLGTQALIAYKINNSITVKTYNLSSYSGVKESKLSFDTWGLSAMEVADEMTIFASMKVPEKAEAVNQVWQVGAAVTDGIPVKHDFAPANLNAKSTLSLTAEAVAAAPSPSPSNGTSGSSSNTTSNGKDSSGGDARKMSVGLFLSALVLIVGSLFVV